MTFKSCTIQPFQIHPGALRTCQQIPISLLSWAYPLNYPGICCCPWSRRSDVSLSISPIHLTDRVLLQLMTANKCKYCQMLFKTVNMCWYKVARGGTPQVTHDPYVGDVRDRHGDAIARAACLHAANMLASKDLWGEDCQLRCSLVAEEPYAKPSAATPQLCLLNI